jgi:CheY-like chemotaxis protein
MNSAALDVLLVDDESLARDKMRRFLAEIAPSARVREAANGIEAVRMIEEKAPDLLFLDIQTGLTSCTTSPSADSPSSFRRPSMNSLSKRSRKAPVIIF